MKTVLTSHPHVLIAPVTPMNAAGEVDLELVAPLYDVLRARGADGFYLNGGTGEGMLLSIRERKQLIEHWSGVAAGRVPLVVHVGCVSAMDAIELAEHAASLGVTAISAIAPPVYVAADIRQLVASLAEVADVAPRTPFYFYHNSAAPGPKFSGYEFLTVASQMIPTLAGIKFTHEDLFDLSRCLRFEDGRYRIFYGKDEFLLGAHAVGAKDFIGGSFNVVSPLVKRTLQAFAQGDIDEARASHHLMVDVIGVLRKHGGLPAVKAALSMFGVDGGKCRLPLKSLASTRSLFDDLQGIWPGMDVSPAAQLSEVAMPIG